MIIDNVHILHLIGLILIYRENKVKHHQFGLKQSSQTKKKNIFWWDYNRKTHFLDIFVVNGFAIYIYRKTKISTIDQVLLHH